MENIKGNKESAMHIIFCIWQIFYYLASEIEVLVFAKKVRKTFGKQTFLSSSTSTCSVRRSDTSKSLDLFCFMNSKAASMICSLGTSSQKIYCYHLTAKMKGCFPNVYPEIDFVRSQVASSVAPDW
jgi:hypothetical protein